MADKKVELHSIFQYTYEGEHIGYHGDTFGTKVTKREPKRYSPETVQGIAKQLEIIRKNAHTGMTNKDSWAHSNWKDFPDPEMLDIIPQQVPYLPVYYKVHRVEEDGTLSPI